MVPMNARTRYTLLLLAGLALPCHAQNWSTWRGPTANGISKETGWKPTAINNPKIVWRTNVGSGHSAVCVVGNVIFTMGYEDGEDVVACYLIKNGKKAWSFSYPARAGSFEGPRTSPVLSGRHLYTMSQSGVVHCIDARKGTKVWSVDLMDKYGAEGIKWGLAGSPVISGNAVILNAGQHGIALNKTTGAKLWASPRGKGGYASPVIFTHRGKKVAAIFGAKALYCVAVDSGRQLMSYPWNTKHDVNAADPIVSDNKIFISSGYKRGCALLSIADNELHEIWENREMANHFASSVLLGKHIYGIHGNSGGGQLRCLSVATGAVAWEERGGFENMIIANGKIIATDKSGYITIASAVPSGFKPLAKSRILNSSAKNWTAPILAKGHLFCRNSNGDLVCIKMR